ncbi:S10A1 protein, partial [Amia calva]|nr:S10A1 protein [Amia calva]
MTGLITVFHNYAQGGGDNNSLNKSELKKLLNCELYNFMGKQNDDAKVSEIMKELDENGDGKVDFQEFVTLIGALTFLCNECFQDM